MQTVHWSQRGALIGVVAALILAAVPLSPAFAAGEGQDVRGDRLERRWAQQQKIYERQGRMLDGAEALARKVQALIERAEENGKDTAALQAALDRFEAAVAEAQRIHEQAGAIIAEHAGFDADGKLTDPEQAARSVEALGEALQEFRSVLGPALQAMHAALRDFLGANRPAERPGREDS